jgi:fatty-acyl-CoA synthase
MTADDIADRTAGDRSDRSTAGGSDRTAGDRSDRSAADGSDRPAGPSGPAGDMSLADAWEAVADAVPDRPAVVHGDLELTWREFEERSARLAGHLAAAGLGPGSKVACYLYNGNEYLEATFGAFKARCVPVNVNYRYLESELLYLLDNSDAEAVVVDATFVERLGHLLDRLPLVRTVLVVGAGAEHPVPPGGPWVDYESALAAATPQPRIPRSGEDLWFLYTGGTTGMPKGVMWPHRSLLGTAAPTFRVLKVPVPTTPEGIGEVAGRFHDSGRAVRLLPAAPLMHGTSAIASIGVLTAGGCVVTLTSRSLDAHELCRTVEQRRVTQLTIVGDAFAKPVLAALEEAAEQGRPYDLSSLRMVVSSGVMWSQPVKDELLRWCDAVLADLVGSSEGVGFANSVAKRGRSAETARFRLGEHARVFTESGEEVAPGSERIGMLAVGGPIPVGYYKDPEKSAATFRTFAGRVWSVPGDWATVEADGTIRLLGRGSVCINTAGEKVYPEEVEEVLKLHPAVADANVVGVPDERWGSAVTAVVSLAPGRADSAELRRQLVDHSRTHLAGYKCPKHVVVVDEVRRGPNGKADYRWATATATAGSGTAG